MGKLLDYIRWRGDLTFEQCPFNPLDAAVFTQLVMLDLTGVADVEKGISIKNAFKKYIDKGYRIEDPVGLLISNNVHFMFKDIANSKRYQDLVLYDYEKVYSEEPPCQFNALTIKLDDFVVVSYAGTDDTIVGWHEDFQLLYLDEIPSHRYALKYLNNVSHKFHKKLILCGHSKGANLAMNSMLQAEHKICKKILGVYCFDGPGINKKLYDKVKISDRLEKIVSYIPYRSSIGKLFDHYEEYKIVDSSANLLFQHDLFTWHLLRNDFIYKEEVSPDSTYMDEHLKKLISNLDAKQSETFVNSLFKVFYMTGSKTLLELVKNKGRILPGVVKLNKDEKVLFNDIILKGILSDARMRKILLGVFIERDNIK